MMAADITTAEIAKTIATVMVITPPVVAVAIVTTVTTLARHAGLLFSFKRHV